MNIHFVGALTGLISAFRYKAEEYNDTIKMGRLTSSRTLCL